jgi:hypothetical protein
MAKTQAQKASNLAWSFSVPGTPDMHDSEDFGGPNNQETPANAAEYIASLADELSHLAKRNGLDALSYILDMARLEADQVAKDSCQARADSRSLPRRNAL